MNKVCAAGETVKGVDVSHYQPKVDWKGLKAEGYQFAFLKASEGLSYVDKLFAGHRKNAKAAGLLVGAYHFLRPNVDPIAQARHFARVIGDTKGELPPVLDWETSDSSPGADDVAEGVAFLNELEKLTGRTPIIYTGPYFFQSLGSTTRYLNKYPLWIAHYGTKCPLVPSPWTYWTFHQYTDKGNIQSIAGVNEDANVFNGSLDQLKRFVKS